MRQQYHFRDSERGLLIWDVFRLIELSKDVPIVEIPLTEIRELDEEFWYELGGARPTCRSVAEHAKLIQEADLNYPIILCYEGRVMDGMHRVCKAQLLGYSVIKAVQFSEPIDPDYVDIDPENLSYD